MAYRSKDLCALAYGNGFTLWVYSTEDAAETVTTEGYFNAAAARLRLGDRLFLNSSMGGTPVFSSTVVIANDGAVVNLADVTAMTATDSA